jgi:hypothetical protein
MNKTLKEDGEAFSSTTPENAMGSSSSTAGTGGIDTYDPLLKKNKKSLRQIVSRKMPNG